MRAVPRFVPLALILCIAVSASSARADEFRIESQVFVGKEKQPLSENLTLFRAGIVYDYLANPPRTAVFDKQHGRFILLDPARKVKTEVTTTEVETFIKDLHDLAAQSNRALVRFQADPKFDVTLNDESGELVLSSSQMTYRLDTIKCESREAAGQYREYSDWYVRLNAMTNPGSNPPFARLTVNAELAERSLVARRVELTAGRGNSVHSLHKIAWKLLPKDHAKIADTGNELTAFKAVTPTEFSRPEVAKK